MFAGYTPVQVILTIAGGIVVIGIAIAIVASLATMVWVDIENVKLNRSDAKSQQLAKKKK